MKVFISWSKERSHEVGILLSEWLEDLMQVLDPWISSEDIDSGSRWNSVINKELKETSVGIICLTQENKNNPWILFEAGALAKEMDNSIIGTFLIDLKSQDLTSPLSQFNHTTPEKDSVLKLFKTINKALGENGRPEAKLERAFNDRWDDFNKKFQEILTENPSDMHIKEVPERDILLEILSSTRSLEKSMTTIRKSQILPTKSQFFLDELNQVEKKPQILPTMTDFNKIVESYEILKADGLSEIEITNKLLSEGITERDIVVASKYNEKLKELRNQSTKS